MLDLTQPLPDCLVTCRCGHTGPLDAFAVETDRWACPACGWRWRVNSVGSAKIGLLGTLQFPRRVCQDDPDAQQMEMTL
ncbi:hypothetical protein [Imhoffiella purpurea]|uniref:Uncharacterized protein n=1 Tax=Imhoffiella purpurea TaxID=1249627 RepID=W9W300_9GAMM|nr:hypothetical protein [Imhoffiella purpurea]EXJ16950.1 hypothetical protein D779_1773 [Imhoffiella purpurea]